MPELNDQDRTRLDGIVSQMHANGESDENIQAVVNDFKTKYSAPQTPVQKFMGTLGQGNLAAGLKFLGDVVQVGDDPAARQRVRDFVSGSAGALFHEPSRILGELDAARTAKDPEEARQHLSRAMPLFGPQWDKIQHQIDQGAYAEATANFVDMLGQVVGPELATRYAPPLLKAVVRTGTRVAESPVGKATAAFVKTATPDVVTGAGKMAVGAALGEAIPGVPLPTSAKAAIGALGAAYKSGAGKQIIGGLKQGWEAGKEAYAAAQPDPWVQLPDGRWTRGGMTPEEAIQEVKTPYTPPPGGPGYRRPPRNPPPPPGAAPPEPPLEPPEELPPQPPQQPSAAAEPPDEPPGGGGAAAAPQAAQTAADELQARRTAEAQQAAANIDVRREGFKARARAARQPAVQQFGDWLAGQGYTADMAEAISEGTKQNLERWRMMAQQANTDTPTPSGMKDVVKYMRAQEAAKAAATQQPPAPAPAQPAAPETPPKSLEEIIAAEAARRAQAARATAEAMQIMKTRPYGY